MDQGWCASTWLLRVQQGHADGVNLGGRTLAIALDFPGPTLYDGNGTARSTSTMVPVLINAGS